MNNIKIKTFLLNKKDTLLDMFVILVFASVPFLRVGLDGVIRPGDSNFPLYPLEAISRRSYTWFEFGSLFGNDGSFGSLAYRIFYFVPAFFSFLGLSINMVNRITYIMFFTFLGWSAYLMARIIMSQSHRFAPILCGIFYMYNPYIIGFINLGHWYSILSFATLPILVLSLVKGLEQRAQWKKWAFIFAMVSPIIIPRVRLFPIFLGYLGLYLILYMVVHHSLNHILYVIKFICLIIISVMFFNLSWILPTLINFNSVYELLTPSNFLSQPFSLPSTFDSILNIVNLVGYGIPMNEYGLFFKSPPALFTAICIIILVYLAILFHPKDLTVIFFSLTTIYSTLLMIAVIKIRFVMDLYLWINGNLPTPLNLLLFPKSFEYLSLPIALSYAFLISATFNMLVRGSRDLRINIKIRSKRYSMPFRFKTISPKFFGFFMMILIIYNSFPLFAGTSGDFLSPINVPNDYDESRDWLHNQKQDFKILAIPHSDVLEYMRHPWAYNGRYSITDILPQVSPIPVISSKPGLGFSLGSDIVDLAYSSISSTSGQKILELLGVKYVLVRNDMVNSKLNYSASLERIYGLEKRIGELEFYRNPAYAPIIYHASVALPIWGRVESLIPLTYVNGLKFNSTFFSFIDRLNTEDRLLLLNCSRTLLIFDKKIEDQTLLQTIADKDISVSYLFNWTFPSRIEVLEDGIYNLTTIELNSLRKSSRVLNLRKASTFLSPHFDASLSSDSIHLAGKSTESDTVNVTRNELLASTNIKWTLDIEKSGFHALCINLNQSQWGLKELALSGGGIAMKVYGDGSGREFRLSFMAPKENYFYWPLQTIYINWYGWKELFFPLNRFESIGDPDWNDVVGLLVWQQVTNKQIGKNELQITNITKMLSPRVSILSSVESWMTNSGKKVEIETIKNSPVSYTINVCSENPFFFVLNVAYNKGWHAFINGHELPHFLANSYANGYYVPITGKFSIELTYPGQQFFDIGTYISGIGFTIALFYVTGIGKFLHLRIFNYYRSKNGTRK